MCFVRLENISEKGRHKLFRTPLITESLACDDDDARVTRQVASAPSHRRR
jgi:hypothetical protein